MMDWVGSGKSTFITLGASNHTNKEREANDYYATDPIAIDALVGAIGDIIPHNVWECACGEGHLSKRLMHFGYNVCSSDKVDRGYGELKDFLNEGKMPDGCECIITNPPYKYALDFVRHSLNILPPNGLSIMFLKTTFLEGKKRYDELFSVNPPMLMLQFSKRVLCAKNGEFQRMRDGGGSAVSYAWYVFRKGYNGDTVIKWI